MPTQTSTRPPQFACPQSATASLFEEEGDAHPANLVQLAQFAQVVSESAAGRVNASGGSLRRIRFPWFEPELDKGGRHQQGLFGSGQAPMRFHSGSTAYWDCLGVTLARQPVGIAATAVPKANRGKLFDLLARYNAEGGQVFVDSGAFGAFVAGESVDFQRDVFPVYDELIGRAVVREALHLVMPDVVGDPASSLRLQQTYATKIRGWIDAGATCIFPLHSPTDEGFLAAAYEVAGGRSIAIGVPSNLAAWSGAELARFCERVQPEMIHLLGLGSAERVQAMADMVHAVSPATRVTCDSCTLLAHVGYGRRLTDRCNSRLQDAVTWIMDDETAEAGFPDLSTYVCDVLRTPNFLTDVEVRGIAVHLQVDVDALLAASREAGLLAFLGTVDPDEQWVHRSLAEYVRKSVYRRKLEAELRGPIRAWEVARVAGLPDEEIGERAGRIVSTQ